MTATILTMPQAADFVERGLADQFTGIREALMHTTTFEDALAIWRCLRAMEQQLSELSDLAARRCDALVNEGTL